jgi:hypothetical protein
MIMHSFVGNSDGLCMFQVNEASVLCGHWRDEHEGEKRMTYGEDITKAVNAFMENTEIGRFVPLNELGGALEKSPTLIQRVVMFENKGDLNPNIVRGSLRHALGLVRVTT